MKQKIYLITGLMASGKSTVSDLLAKSIEKCVHLRGDVFRKMIISGRENMSATPSAEAVRQLYLRYKLTADAARSYFDNGFSVVIQDNYYGDELNRMINYLHKYPVEVVVLCPDVETIKERERYREKTGYSGFTVETLYDTFMQTTPRIGFWLDNSNQTPQQTAETILNTRKPVWKSPAWAGWTASTSPSSRASTMWLWATSTVPRRWGGTPSGTQAVPLNIPSPRPISTKPPSYRSTEIHERHRTLVLLLHAVFDVK